MSQDLLLDICKKNKGIWFSKKKLKPLVPFNQPSLVRSMSKLIKYKDLYKIEVKKGKRNKQFIRIK